MIRIFAKLTTSDPKFGAYFDRNAKKNQVKYLRSRGFEPYTSGDQTNERRLIEKVIKIVIIFFCT